MGMIAPIRTANGALFWGVSGECSSGKFLRLNFSELLKFSKSMPGYHAEHVMLKYLINHRCGCGQRSNYHLMMLAGAEVIAARAQLPAKGSNIVSLKSCQIQFV